MLTSTKLLLGLGGFAAVATTAGVVEHYKNKSVTAAATGGAIKTMPIPSPSGQGGLQQIPPGGVQLPSGGSGLLTPPSTSTGFTQIDVYLQDYNSTTHAYDPLSVSDVGTIGSTITIHIPADDPSAVINSVSADGVAGTVSQDGTSAAVVTQSGNGLVVVNWTTHHEPAKTTIQYTEQ